MRLQSFTYQNQDLVARHAVVGDNGLILHQLFLFLHASKYKYPRDFCISPPLKCGPRCPGSNPRPRAQQHSVIATKLQRWLQPKITRFSWFCFYDGPPVFKRTCKLPGQCAIQSFNCKSVSSSCTCFLGKTSQTRFIQKSQNERGSSLLCNMCFRGSFYATLYIFPPAIDAPFFSCKHFNLKHVTRQLVHVLLPSHVQSFSCLFCSM